ncbi:Rib/alpha-like domain-containing protein [Tuanshanicoccus lijuaniae]|uniref:Rib/alpha-like domain-containing protein n=1 Tax=Aerococcaceae bacterium zg-1292 TaxID=2774330 RepID=UPI004064B414
MLGKNNMRIISARGANKKLRYSIKKFSVGVASVLIGATFLSSNQLVSAQEVTNREGTEVVEAAPASEAETPQEEPIQPVAEETSVQPEETTETSAGNTAAEAVNKEVPETTTDTAISEETNKKVDFSRLDEMVENIIRVVAISIPENTDMNAATYHAYTNLLAEIKEAYNLVVALRENPNAIQEEVDAAVQKYTDLVNRFEQAIGNLETVKPEEDKVQSAEETAKPEDKQAQTADEKQKTEEQAKPDEDLATLKPAALTSAKDVKTGTRSNVFPELEPDAERRAHSGLNLLASKIHDVDTEKDANKSELGFHYSYLFGLAVGGKYTINMELDEKIAQYVKDITAPDINGKVTRTFRRVPGTNIWEVPFQMGDGGLVAGGNIGSVRTSKPGKITLTKTIGEIFGKLLDGEKVFYRTYVKDANGKVITNNENRDTESSGYIMVNKKLPENNPSQDKNIKQLFTGTNSGFAKAEGTDLGVYFVHAKDHVWGYKAEGPLVGVGKSTKQWKYHYEVAPELVPYIEKMVLHKVDWTVNNGATFNSRHTKKEVANLEWDANGKGSITEADMNKLFEFNNGTNEPVVTGIGLKLKNAPQEILEKLASDTFPFTSYFTDKDGNLIPNSQATALYRIKDERKHKDIYEPVVSTGKIEKPYGKGVTQDEVFDKVTVPNYNRKKPYTKTLINPEKLPDGKTAGDFEAIVRVTYPDNTFDEVKVPITIGEGMNKKYAPKANPITKEKGQKTTLTDIFQAVEVPDYPTDEDTYEAVPKDMNDLPDGNTAGTFKVPTIVTYPDGSKDEVEVTVTVKEKAKIADETEVKDPEKTTVNDITRLTSDDKDKVKAAVETANPGLKDKSTITVGDDGAVTIKYKDDSEDMIPGERAVKQRPMNEIYEPTPGGHVQKNYGGKVTEEEIFGQVVIPDYKHQHIGKIKKEIADGESLPDGKKEGIHKVKVKVTYPDGTTDFTEVAVIINKPLSKDFPPEVTSIVKEYGQATTEDEIKEAVKVPRYNDEKNPVTVTVKPGAKLPDGKTPGDFEVPAIVTYPDSTVEVKVPVKVKTIAEGMTVNKPDKTPVDDINNLTPDEKVIVKTKVKNTNPKFPDGTEFEVGNDGKVTITYPDKSVDTIPGEDTVEPKPFKDTYTPAYKDSKAFVGEKTTTTPTFTNKKGDSVSTKDVPLAEKGAFILDPSADVPKDLTVDPKTGGISFTPTKEQVGKDIVVPVTVTYKDGTTNTVLAKFTVADKKTDADKYTPSYEDKLVKPGEEAKSPVSFKDGETPTKAKYAIKDGFKAPDGYIATINETTGEVSLKAPERPSKDTAEVIEVPVVVTYADGTKDEDVMAKFSLDTDGDGIPDNKDQDDDGDGIPDTEEGKDGTNPKDPYSVGASIEKIEDQTVKLGNSINTITVKATKVPKGGKVDVKDLPKGVTFDPKTNQISGTPTEPGKYIVAVGVLGSNNEPVLDKDNKPVFITFKITVEKPDQTEKLAVTTKSATVTENQPVPDKTNVVTTNKPGAKITSTPTNGLSVDEKGNLTGKPTITDWKEKEESRVIEVPVTVTNGEEEVEEIVKVTVNRDTDGDGQPDIEDQDDDGDGIPDTEEEKDGTNPKDPNSAVFSITPIKDQTAKVNKPIDPITVEATKVPTGGKVDVKGLPDGLSYDADKGVITGTPTKPGVTEVTVGVLGKDGKPVTDKDGKPVEAKFKITVEEADQTEKLAVTTKSAIVTENQPVPDKTNVVTTNKPGAKVTSTPTNGLSVDEEGNLTGKPTITDWNEKEESRVIEVPVTVTNGDEKVEEVVKVTVNRDTDGDGQPDIEDQDDDGDGIPDTEEGKDGTNPKNPNSAVSSITPIKDQTAKVKKPIDPITVEATKVPTGGKVDVKGLPDGLSYDADKKVITGTPTKPGVTEVTVGVLGKDGKPVTDKDGKPVEAKFKITVKDLDKNVYEPKGKDQTVKMNETPKAEDSIENMKDLPDGTKAEFETPIDTKTPGEKKGKVTVTYPDGTKDTINVIVKVIDPRTDADKTDVVNPDKTEVEDTKKLTDAEKDKVKKEVEKANPDLPKDTDIQVGNDGTVTITYPDKSVDTIPGKDTVKPKEPTIADKTDVVNPDKTEVEDTKKLTDAEKDKVKKEVEKANPDLPKDTDIQVGNDGTVTITYPDKSVDTIPGKDTVKPKEPTIADKTDVVNPDKTEVEDTKKLTDVEKDKVKKEVEKANPDLPKDTDIQVGNDGTVTITYPDKSVDTIPGKDTVKPKEPTIADKTDVANPDKTEVEDTKKLTDAEKDKVKKEVEKANPDLPKDTDIQVGNDGTVTITYPDKSVDTIPGKDTVKPKEPTIADKTDVANPDKTEVEDTKKLTDAEKDKVKKEVEKANPDLPKDTDIQVGNDGTVTITYPDKSVDTIPGKDTVKLKEPTMADKHEPIGKKQTVNVGAPATAEKSIANFDKLPDGTKAEFETPIDTKTPGEKKGKVIVTYPDGSTDTIDVTVSVVKPQTDADKHEPKGKKQTVNVGDPATAEKSIANFGDLPKGTKAEFETPIDTKTPGEKKGKVIVTYPDGSKDTIDVTVNVVNPQRDADKHEPIGKKQTVNVGEPATAEKSIANFGDLPKGTKVEFETPIDTKTPGEKKGKVIVTYPDGSTDTIDVTVSVVDPNTGESPEVPKTDDSTDKGSKEAPKSDDSQASAPKQMAKSATLPATGESNNTAIFGAAALAILSGVGLLGVKSKKEEEEA